MVPEPFKSGETVPYTFGQLRAFEEKKRRVPAFDLNLFCTPNEKSGLISRRNISIPYSRYFLLKDMVKDATHHPDYKVFMYFIDLRSRRIKVKFNPPSLRSTVLPYNST